MSDDKEYNRHTCGEGPLGAHVVAALQSILSNGPGVDCNDSYKGVAIAAEVIRRAFNFEPYDPLKDPEVTEMFGPLAFAVRAAWMDHVEVSEQQEATRREAEKVVDDGISPVDTILVHNNDDDDDGA